MIRSLSIKLAMLAITMGVVFWITWQPIKVQPTVSEAINSPLPSTSASIAETRSQTGPATLSAGGRTAVASGVSTHLNVAGHAVPRLVDLNSATVDELESLPGIGAVLAQRVIAYRTSVGRFLAVEDLREVKGIGAKKFEQVKSLVTVAREAQKSKTEKRTS